MEGARCMDVTDLHQGWQLPVATVACEHFEEFGAALGRMWDTGATAVVVRSGGPAGRAEFARFAVALIAGAGEAQRTATAWRPA
jgi:hypothetical protein